MSARSPSEPRQTNGRAPHATNLELPYGFVARDRLLPIIDLPYLAPLTLISAPTGYGKSALAMHWANSTAMSVCWIQLAPRLNSLSALVEDIRVRASDALGRPVRSTHGPDRVGDGIGDFLAQFWNESAERSSLCIVLNDYQVIDNRDVHEAVTHVIHNLPPNLHLMLTSRATPPLPIGRLRAQGKVRELSGRDLAFDTRETHTYLAERKNFIVSEPIAADLANSTEGWIAGIQLATFAAGRTGQDPHRLMTVDPTRSDYLDDYIGQEVLDLLAPKLREFVVDTAFLPALDPTMCDEVLKRTGSAKLVAELVAQRVFVVPDNQQPGIYRYHHMFASSVQRLAARERSQEEISTIRRRLAAWCLERGERERGLEYFIADRDWDSATPLLISICGELADRDLYHSILHWLRQVPESVRLGQDNLAYWYTFSLLALGHLREGIACFNAVEPIWTSHPEPIQRGRALACKAMILGLTGDENGLLEASIDSLGLFPESARVERLHGLLGVMEVEFSRGNDEAVQAAFATAQQVRTHLPPDQRWWTLHMQLLPANHLALRGNLPAARAIYHEQLKELSAYLIHPCTNCGSGWRISRSPVTISKRRNSTSR